ncbi:919_t:CDS:2 [Acaulospora morrowiae]|uniref:919_t:CDS:1 n=1 Tax=Acaulospora morrowiae TaxID=94023 RepID=A0A9N9EXU0_9GLOM|nr:919_t:CDS:2 [Acaulospora morrowiae]
MRCGIGTFVITLYLIYLSFLAYQIATDNPLIQISYEYLERLSIPDIEICGSYSDVKISKCVFTWNDWSSTTFNNCATEDYSFLTTDNDHTKDNQFCYLFSTNSTFFYGNADKKPKGPWVRNIDFYFKITNISAVTSHFLSVGTISCQLMDPVFNPLWKVVAKNPAKERVQQEFRLQINAFSGIQNMSTTVSFRKISFLSILDYDVSSIFGLKPNYDTTPYLNSAPKYFSLHQNENFTLNGLTGHFSVSPGSFLHEIQSEKRTHTIFGSLGVAGGAIGLIGGIYVLLFGHPRRDPWGLMHRVMKTEITQENLRNLPFVSDGNVIIETLSTEQKVEMLDNKIRGLETILEDYIFNPTALKQLGKRKIDSN